MNKTLVIGIITAVIFGGGGFYGGMIYTQSKISGARGQFAQGTGGNFAGRAGSGGARFAGGGAVFGAVIAKDTASITVKIGSAGSPTDLPAGYADQTGTKIVLYNASTQVGKLVNGTASDLSVGDMITVNGTANSDGSVTARTIQIRPVGTTASETRGQ